MKIPAMGFSDYFIQTVTTDASPGQETDTTGAAATAASETNAQKSDQEILEGIEQCYYSPDSNPQLYELKVNQV